MRALGTLVLVACSTTPAPDLGPADMASPVADVAAVSDGTAPPDLLALDFAAPDLAWYGCGKDSDCKGDRLCVYGECVEPPDMAAPDLVALDLVTLDLVLIDEARPDLGRWDMTDCLQVVFTVADCADHKALATCESDCGKPYQPACNRWCLSGAYPVLYPDPQGWQCRPCP